MQTSFPPADWQRLQQNYFNQLDQSGLQQPSLLQQPSPLVQQHYQLQLGQYMTAGLQAYQGLSGPIDDRRTLEQRVNDQRAIQTMVAERARSLHVEPQPPKMIDYLAITREVANL